MANSGAARSTAARTHQARVAFAALNNAHWCAAMCRAHGGRGHFSASLWHADGKTPRLYPKAVTLGNSAQAQAEIRRKLASAHLPADSAVKDSFAALDLGGLGFVPLFDATWLWRPAGAAISDARSNVQWAPIESEADLDQWQQAWHPEPLDEAIFVPALLQQEEHAIFAGRRGQEIVAGGVVSWSGGVIGLSNWFNRVSDSGTDDGVVGDGAILAGCLDTIAALHPNLPMAGYETAERLSQFTTQGFEAIGPLRVWRKS